MYLFILNIHSFSLIRMSNVYKKTRKECLVSSNSVITYMNHVNISVFSIKD